MIVWAVLAAQTVLAGTAYDLMAPVVKVYAGESVGSGVVLEEEKVLTCAHVVGSKKIVVVVVYFWDEAQRKIVGTFTVDGVVVKVDQEKDLALIELDCILDFPPVEFASEDSLEILEPIVCVGAPFMKAISIFRGVVTDQECEGLIQTDAFAQPGCSGGALWVWQDNQWKLLGVLTRAFRGTALSFFVPVSKIKEFLDEFRSGTHAECAYGAA